MRRKNTKSVFCLILVMVEIIVAITIVKLATLGYDVHITVEKQKIEVSTNQIVTNSNN